MIDLFAAADSILREALGATLSRAALGFQAWEMALPMTESTDLFGHPGPAQHSLFGGGDCPDRLQAQRFHPDPAAIRLRLQNLLATAREARAMPWSQRDARMWQTVFPNMANWLPEEEATQLRLAFMQEMQRLQPAA